MVQGERRLQALQPRVHGQIYFACMQLDERGQPHPALPLSRAPLRRSQLCVCFAFCLLLNIRMRMCCMRAAVFGKYSEGAAGEAVHSICHIECTAGKTAEEAVAEGRDRGVCR